MENAHPDSCRITRTRTIISHFEMIKENLSQFLINLIKILSKYKSLETILLTCSIKVLLSTFMVRIISILTPLS